MDSQFSCTHKYMHMHSPPGICMVTSGVISHLIITKITNAKDYWSNRDRWRWTSQISAVALWPCSWSLVSGDDNLVQGEGRKSCQFLSLPLWNQPVACSTMSVILARFLFRQCHFISASVSLKGNPLRWIAFLYTPVTSIYTVTPPPPPPQ